eukprot:scaffold40430_cov65-Phaeocystis_antarctica.AAC.6
MSSCQATEAVRAQARVSRELVSTLNVRASDAAARWGHGEAVQSGSTGQRPRRRGAAYLLRCLRLVDAVTVKQEADRVGGDALPVAESVHELLQRSGLFALEVDLVAVLRDHLQVDVLASLLLLLVSHSTSTGYCAEVAAQAACQFRPPRAAARGPGRAPRGRQSGSPGARVPLPALACMHGRDAGYGVVVALFFGAYSVWPWLSPPDPCLILEDKIEILILSFPVSSLDAPHPSTNSASPDSVAITSSSRPPAT